MLIEIKIDVKPSYQDWVASSGFQDVGGEIESKSEIVV